MAKESSDPIPELMRITGLGFLSQIKYDKEDGRAASTRVIEPRSMAEGPSGLLIRTVQVRPKRGVRMFMVRRIVDVEETAEPLVSPNNQFCDGEVVMTGSSSAKDGGQASAFDAPWFIEYADTVREAIDDYQVEGWELDRIERLKERLGLTLGQVRAVHAYIFAECLLAYAIDGDFDANEEEQLEQIADCLDELGWRPA